MALHDYLSCIFVIDCDPFFSSKTAIQLLSQSVLIDMRGICRPGNMCALCDLSGRLCWGSSAMSDDVMLSPFGILIGIGWVAVCLFVHGVDGVM